MVTSVLLFAIVNLSVLVFLPPASVGWGKVIVLACYFVHTREGGGHLPWPGPDGGRGYPKIPTPPPSQVRTGGG